MTITFIYIIDYCSTICSKDVLEFAKVVRHLTFDLVMMKGWNHIDFIYGIDANVLVYKRIINALNKH